MALVMTQTSTYATRMPDQVDRLQQCLDTANGQASLLAQLKLSKRICD